MADLLDTIKGLVPGDDPDDGSPKSWPLDKKVPKVDWNTPSEGVFMTSSWLAHVVFGQNSSSTVTNTPYLEFQYFVKINLNPALKEFYTEYLGSTANPSIDYAPLIQSIDMPGMSMETTPLNEYNRWRTSQTKINYESVKMSIFDSNNGVGLNLWRMYYEYYFRDGVTARGETEKGKLPIMPSAFEHNDTFGFRLMDKYKDIRYLITSIEIFQLHNFNANHIILHNPKISGFSQGTMSYASSTAMALDFTFEPEFVTYAGNARISHDEDLTKFLSQSYVPDGSNQFASIEKYDPATPVLDIENPGEQSLLDDIMNVKNPQDALDALKRGKSEAKDIIGQGARLGAQFNQFQMDITGKDQPIIKAPSVRDVNAKVSEIPTGYSDIRRFSRNNFQK